MTATRKDIQTAFAETVRKETGASVEVTIISADRFSIYGTIAAVAAADSLVKQVPTVTYIETATFVEDDEACSFYRFG